MALGFHMGGSISSTSSIPNGRTVTPINDVTIWQKCAGIANPTYITLADILADVGVLSALMGSDNAVEYLVRSKQFASDICQNLNAMDYIGANDYASNTLFADADWKTAICNSSYSASVLNLTVPIMTSNTAPKGQVYADSTYSGRQPYYAFNGKSLNLSQADTFWYQASDGTHYIYYMFTKDVTCYKMRFASQTDGSYISATGTFRGSIDGSTWVELSTDTVGVGGTKDYHSMVATTPAPYRYYSLQITRRIPVSELQFYGREKGGVQSLLRKAGITNTNYTNVSQLLSDTDSLQTVISSHDAIDYLVTCTAFIDDFTSSSTAMTYIGQNNYASNTLLADSDWRDAICNSAYFESVLNAKVPTMTSNTTPSGVASASGEASGREAYQAFDGNNNTSWRSSNATSSQSGDAWIDYEFVSENAPKLMQLSMNDGTIVTGWSYTIQYSSDGVTYTDYETKTPGAVVDISEVMNVPLCKHIRFKFTNRNCRTGSNTYLHLITTLQFYGRKDV